MKVSAIIIGFKKKEATKVEKKLQKAGLDVWNPIKVTEKWAKIDFLTYITLIRQTNQNGKIIFVAPEKVQENIEDICNGWDLYFPDDAVAYYKSVNKIPDNPGRGVTNGVFFIDEFPLEEVNDTLKDES